MARIVLLTMKCDERQESDWNGDEIRIFMREVGARHWDQVWSGDNIHAGGPEMALTRHGKNVSRPFSNKVEVRMQEVDSNNWYDRHDELGVKEAQATPTDSAELKFTEKTANYIIYYRIES